MNITLIGSRKAPSYITSIMEKFGKYLSDKGHYAYSGGAFGSDEAWLKNYDRSLCTRIIPYYGFMNHKKSDKGVICWKDLSNQAKIKSIAKAKEVVSYWDDCSDIVKILFARDCTQVLGLECLNPVDKVIYWAPEKCDGSISGGTRVAVQIARRHGIECINIQSPAVYKKLKEKFCDFSIFDLN